MRYDAVRARLFNRRMSGHIVMVFGGERDIATTARLCDQTTCRSFTAARRDLGYLSHPTVA